MTGMEYLETRSAFRLLLFFWILAHGYILCANLLQTYDTFNPGYWVDYFRQQCLRPLLGIVLFVICLLAEDWLLFWLNA